MKAMNAYSNMVALQYTMSISSNEETIYSLPDDRFAGST